jgi:hypothetical protein
MISFSDLISQLPHPDALWAIDKIGNVVTLGATLVLAFVPLPPGERPVRRCSPPPK